MENKTLLVIIASVACFAFVSVGNSGANNGKIAGNADLALSSTEQKYLTDKATKGDPESAFRLYEFYSCVMFDQIEALFWLRTAAGLGYPKAEYSLSVYYLDNYPKNLSNARIGNQWLEKAKRDGWPKTQ